MDGALRVVYESQGLGISVGGGLSIVGVIPSSASEAAGVKAGMIIVAVNDTDVAGRDPGEVMNTIRSLPRPLAITFAEAGKVRIHRGMKP